MVSTVHGLDLGQRGKVVEAAELLSVTAARELGDRAERQMQAYWASLALSANPLGAETQRRVEALASGFTGDAPEERHILTALAFARALTLEGGADSAAELALTVWRDPAFLREALRTWAPTWVIFTLGLCGRIDESEACAATLLDAYGQRGNAVALSCIMAWQAHLSWLRGDVDACAERTAESLAVAGHDRFPFGRPWRAGLLIETRLLQDDVTGAERAEADAAAHGGFHDLAFVNVALGLRARARLRLAQNRPEEAARDLDEFLRRKRERGGYHPSVTSDVPLMLHALGREDEARAEACEAVEQARGWGVPAFLGLTLRVRGLVADRREDLSEAVSQLEGSFARLELAGALVEHGAALRRANERQASRDPLRRGGDLAQRCGATALARRAREELEATGARSRSLVLSGVESLTASERRVAAMAAEGRTNTEIAQALYVTRKTVETYLRHIFQKLDVSSRRELPAKLAA